MKNLENKKLWHDRLRPDWLSLTVLLVFVSAWCGTLLSWGGLTLYPLDDAYIIQHSVAGILKGSEDRFIASAPWLGVTCPFYVLMIAALTKFLPVEIAHFTVSALGLLALAFGYYALARQHSLSPLKSSLLTIGALFSGYTLLQVHSGLETGLAMALVTWVLVAFANPRPPLWGYALAGLGFAIRPELAALIPAVIAFALWKHKKQSIRGLGVLVIATVAAAILTLATIGSLFSNTTEAKQIFFYEGKISLWLSIGIVALGFAKFVMTALPLGLGLFSPRMSRATPLAWLFALLVLSAFALKMPMGVTHNYFRYLYILAPLLVLGWCTALTHPEVRRRHLAYLAGAIALAAVVAMGPQIGYKWRASVEQYSLDHFRVAHWVARNVPAKATIAIHDAGVISTIGTQPLVDLVGLKSPSSVELNKNNIKPDGSFKPAIPEILDASAASYLIVTREWEEYFGLTEIVRSAGWSLERVDPGPENSMYRAYKLSPPVSDQ